MKKPKTLKFKQRNHNDNTVYHVPNQEVKKNHFINQSVFVHLYFFPPHSQQFILSTSLTNTSLFCSNSHPKGREIYTDLLYEDFHSIKADESFRKTVKNL